MSSLETRKIEPQSSTTVTLGEAGDTVLVSADQLKTNTVKDAGGNTLFTSNGAGTLSSVNSAFVGSMDFITSQTASASTSIAFTTQLTDAYDEYVFYFVDINLSTDNQRFEFQVNASGQTGFNEVMTTTFFYARHSEAGTNGQLTYYTGGDQAQGTAYQNLGWVSNDADHSIIGELHLFNPSSTTYVKQFNSRTGWNNDTDGMMDGYIAGYINTAAAITEIDFKVQAGTFDGTIYLYGIN